MKYIRYGALAVAALGIVALLSSHFVTAFFFAGLLIGLVVSSWVIKQEFTKTVAVAKLSQEGEERDGLYQQEVESRTQELTQNLTVKEQRIAELDQDLAKALELITKLNQKVEDKDESYQQYQQEVESRTQELTQNLTVKEQRIAELDQDLARALESITQLNQKVEDKDESYQQYQQDMQSRTQELTQDLTAKEQRITELEQDLAKALEPVEIVQHWAQQGPTLLSAFNAACRILPGNPNYFVAKIDAERIRKILEELVQ